MEWRVEEAGEERGLQMRETTYCYKHNKASPKFSCSLGVTIVSSEKQQD